MTVPNPGFARTFTQGAGVTAPGPVVMMYSRPSGVKPPSPLKNTRSSRGGGAGAAAGAAAHPGGREPRGKQIRRAAADLVRQRAAAVGDDRPGDRLEQRPVLVRDLLGRADEDRARAVRRIRLDAGRDEADDLILEHLPVAGAILVPDHEVHRQPLQAPVGVGLHELAHQLDVGRVADLQQHDRQVAGHRVAPQPGLPAPVPGDDGRVGAQRRVRVDDGAGQAAVELRVRLAGVQLPQHDLGVCRGQREHAIGETPVLVLAHERQAGGARLGHARDDVDRDRLVRLEHVAAADRDDRIEHRTLAARERPGLAHRARVGGRPPAAEEAQPVGLVREGAAGRRAVRRHEMEHPGRRLAARARAPRAEDGALVRDDLGLDEEVAERRVQRVGGRGGERHLRVARHLDRPARAAAVGQAQPAQLDIVLGRHGDLGVALDLVRPAAELGAGLGEHRLEPIGRLRASAGAPWTRRRRSRRPGCSRTSPSCPRSRPRASG